jgi:hypothetical protein
MFDSEFDNMIYNYDGADTAATNGSVQPQDLSLAFDSALMSEPAPAGHFNPPESNDPTPAGGFTAYLAASHDFEPQQAPMGNLQPHQGTLGDYNMGSAAATNVPWHQNQSTTDLYFNTGQIMAPFMPPQPPQDLALAARMQQNMLNRAYGRFQAPNSINPALLGAPQAFNGYAMAPKMTLGQQNPAIYPPPPDPAAPNVSMGPQQPQEDNQDVIMTSAEAFQAAKSNRRAGRSGKGQLPVAAKEPREQKRRADRGAVTRKSQPAAEGSSQTGRKCKKYSCEPCRRSHKTCEGGDYTTGAACKLCLKSGKQCTYGVDGRTNVDTAANLQGKIAYFSKMAKELHVVIAFLSVRDPNDQAYTNWQTIVSQQVATCDPAALCNLVRTQRADWQPKPVYWSENDMASIECVIKAQTSLGEGVKLSDLRAATATFMQDSE